MSNLSAQPRWPEVRQLETHELARGGMNGNMNEQAKSLLDRTEFLKSFVENSVTPEMFFVHGEATWDRAFELAQDASDYIVLQAWKKYPILKTFINKSNVVWEGNMAEIVNARTGSNLMDYHAFSLGNMHPAAFNYINAGTGQYLPCFDLASIQAGQDVVTLTDASKSSRLSSGQFAWVRTVEEIWSSGDAYIPHCGQLVKIVEVNGPQVRFEYPIRNSITNACLSPIGETIDFATGMPWHIVENVTIRNLRTDARYFAWTRTGMYKCTLENITNKNGDGILAMNAFCHSKATNIYGGFKVRALEIKCCSHDSTIIKSRSKFTPADGVAMLSGVDIGEQSKRIKLEDVECEVGFHIGGATSIGVTLDVRGQGIEIINSFFSNYANTPTVTGNVAYIRDAQFEGYGTDDILLDNVTLAGNSRRTYLLRVGDTVSAIKGKNIKLNVKYQGEAAIAQASYQGAEVKILNPTKGQFGQVPAMGLSPEVIGGVVELSYKNFDALGGLPELISFANSTGKCWGLDASTDESLTTTLNVPVWATAADITAYLVNTSNNTGDIYMRLYAATAQRGAAVGTAASYNTKLTNPTKDIINAVKFSTTVPCASDGILVLRVARVGTHAEDTLASDIGFIGLKISFR